MTFDPRFFMQLLFQSSVTVDNKLYLHSSEVKTGFCCTFMATWLRNRQSFISLVRLVTAINSSVLYISQALNTVYDHKMILQIHKTLYISEDLCWRHRENENFRWYGHEISVFLLQTSHGQKVSSSTPKFSSALHTDYIYFLH